VKRRKSRKGLAKRGFGEKCDLFSWLIWKDRRIIAGVNLGDFPISGSGAIVR
jgi:hypothetical protein